MSSGYLPASTIYAKIFTPRVQAENNCIDMNTGSPQYHKFRSAMHANLLFEAVDPLLRSHLITHPDYRNLVDPAMQHEWNVEKILAALSMLELEPAYAQIKKSTRPRGSRSKQSSQGAKQRNRCA
jgi:hypothetical protein